MADDGMENVEYNDPLEGLDLGLLSFDKDGKKDNSKDLLAESTRTQFEVRTGEEEPEVNEGNEVISEDTSEDTKEGENKEDVVEFSNDKPTIGVRGEDDTDGGSLHEEKTSNENIEIWKNFAEAGIIELNDDDPEEKDLQWFADKTKEKLDNNVKSALEEYKEDLPEEIRYLIDNHEQGVNVFDLLRADKRVIEYHSIKEEDIEAVSYTHLRAHET